MTTKEHGTKVKQIEKTFLRLQGCCEHLREWQKYLALIDAEEKGHRRFCPAGVQCGLTRSQSVKLFAVQSVFERFQLNVPNWKAEDYFDIRQSILAACAIATKCEEQILKEFADTEMVDFLHTIDYADLNKTLNRKENRPVA